MADEISGRELKVGYVCQSCRKALFPFPEPGFGDEEEHDEPDADLERKVTTEYSWADSFPDLPKLTKSAGACSLCCFLLELVLSADTDAALVGTAGKSRSEIGICDLRISITYLGSARAISWLVVHLQFVDAADLMLQCRVIRAASADGYVPVIPKFLVPAPSQARPASESVDSVKQMLEICDDGHQHAVPEILDTNFVPQYLIDIRRAQPRLIAANRLESVTSVKYTAFSYCWGPPEEAQKQLTTTAHCLRERLSGILDSDSTDALRDAVHITKKLSIPFLWVDSLCIIQDETSSWEQQCAEMGRIYGNAYVTICAASSRHCNEGFLLQRSRQIRLPFQSYSIATAGQSYTVQFKLAANFNGEVAIVDDDTSRWATWGWSFPARILSRRLLIFGKTKTYLRCRNDRDSEGTLSLVMPFLSNLSQSKSTADAYQVWEQKVLAKYTAFGKRSFNNPADLLPALSGVAKTFQQLTQDEYLAGHWRKDMYLGLMWFIPDIDKPRRVDYLAEINPLQPRALTSWSSLSRGNLKFLRSMKSIVEYEPRSEIKETLTQTQVSEHNPFVCFELCRIRIRSTIIDLGALRAASSTAWSITTNRTDQKDFKWTLVFSDSMSSLAVPSQKMLFDFDFHPDQQTSNAVLWKEMVADLVRCKLLLLGSCRLKKEFVYKKWGDEPDEWSDKRGAYGLIVHPVANTDMFYRMGSFVPLETDDRGDSMEVFGMFGEDATITLF